jgi:hypothetical protein
LNAGVSRAVAVVCLAALAAGCGGGGKKSATAPAAHEPAPQSAPGTSPRPTATTNTPPPKHRKTPQPLGGSSTAPLRVTSPYRCHGRPLKALSAAGPVDVRPAIVRSGQSFTVTVTDSSAKVAVVSLAGVAPKPIQASATMRGGRLVATLKMPSYASCGNKLLEVEGDVSAEAYVGVSG